MEKIWEIEPRVSDDIKVQLLSSRGLKQNQEIERFLSPRLNYLTPIQKLLPQIEKAVGRIAKAISNQELIYIYGDYDVDGITGCAILWETIDYLGGKVLPYIPSRRSEGYGLHSEALETLAKNGAKVVISVDCGITAIEQAKVAKNLGIDLIITDHHQPQDQLPQPFALLHTTALAGSGVAFRLAEALLNSFGNDNGQYFKNLELAALGTIADMVPLIGDNRIIVKNGLLSLSQTSRLGLRALYTEAALGKIVGTYEVGFIISPRLNAMGRLDSAMDSLRLLLTRDDKRAFGLAQKLSMTNRERQDKTKEVFEHAKASFEKNYKGTKFIVIDSETYPEGVVGLVASRLVEAYHRPTAVIGKGEKAFKGSARSIKNFNITEAIHTQEKILVSHGGHPMAAGFSILADNIPEFRNNLSDLAEKALRIEDLTPKLKIDSEIDLTQVNTELEDLLKKIEPFGIGNSEPVFLTKDLKVIDVKTVGAENQHLKMLLTDTSGIKLSAVGFSLANKKPKVGESIDVAYNVRANVWNSRKTLEARIKDLRVSNPS